MSDKAKIEWTDATWNPVTGCTKVSSGCKHCYAEREWPRLTKLVPAYAGRAFTDVRTHEDRLGQPLRWKKPRKVFVNSMSDLFHPDVPDEFIDRVFEVMALSQQHTFQVLTKRADRMQDYVTRLNGGRLRNRLLMVDAPNSALAWPLPNVWLGVSVEDQASADERIPLLLDTPAAVRWISAEPLLGPVSFRWAKWHDYSHRQPGFVHNHLDGMRGIDWVVVGGESGPKARPMHPDWARSLRDQCASAGVPFLFKQWGEWFPTSIGQGGSQIGAWNGDDFMPGWGDIKNPDNNMVRAGRHAFGGRLLDGVQHDGYPEVTP